MHVPFTDANNGTGHAARDEAGAVTAETAVVLPLMAAFTVTMVWLVSLGVTQARTVDAAREAARSAARGDTTAQARSWGARVAPDGSRFVITRGEHSIVVKVAAPVRGPRGLFDFLPHLTVRARAVAATEQP